MRRSGKKLLRIALGGMTRECNRQITSVCTVRDLLDGSLFSAAHLKRIFSDDKCRRHQRLRQVQESGKGPWPALTALHPRAEACSALQRRRRLVCRGGAHGQPCASLHGDAFILQSGPLCTRRAAPGLGVLSEWCSVTTGTYRCWVLRPASSCEAGSWSPLSSEIGSAFQNCTG